MKDEKKVGKEERREGKKGQRRNEGLFTLPSYLGAKSKASQAVLFVSIERVLSVEHVPALFISRVKSYTIVDSLEDGVPSAMAKDFFSL